MKNLKLLLDDEESEVLHIGLIRLAKNLPVHEFFFHLNRANPESSLSRISDFEVNKNYYDYCHIRFEGYDRESKSCMQFLQNSSSESKAKSEPGELFFDEEEVNFLLPFHKEVDFVLKTSDNSGDFSLLLWPESLMFSIQDFHLSSDQELYDLIQYYE